MKSMNRIIFLDVDGVLNHSDCPEWVDTSEVLDKEIIERVKRICEKAGAKIVISSTWRKLDSPFRRVVREFGKLIIGTTPDLNVLSRSAHGRAQEILAWLKVNKQLDADIVVIDDDDDAEVPGRPFVQTEFTKGGLTPELGNKVLEAFGLSSCPCCFGSGKVSIEDYLKHGGKTTCFACNGSGSLNVTKDLDNESKTT